MDLCNLLIEEHIGLMFHLVQQYTRKSPRRHDDFLEAAMLGLVKGAQRFVNNGLGGNPTPYLASCITNSMKLCYRRNVEVLPLLDRHKEPFDTYVFRDSLFHVCKTNEELCIAEMKLQGYTDTEIKDKLGVSWTKYTGIRERLYDKFRYIWAD